MPEICIYVWVTSRRKQMQSNSNFEKVKKKPDSPNVGTNDRRAKHSLLRERRLVRKLRLRQKGVA